MAKKASPQVKIVPEKLVRIEKLDGAFPELCEVFLSGLIAEGWTITTCAAVRADGYNRDHLYYTLTRHI